MKKLQRKQKNMIDIYKHDLQGGNENTEEKTTKYSMIILPSEELKKIDIVNLDWKYLAKLDVVNNKEDFDYLIEEVKGFTEFKD